MSLNEQQLSGVHTPPPKWPYVLAVLVAIAAIGAVLWFILRKPAADPAASTNAANAAGEAPASATAPSGRIETLPSGLRIETIRGGTGPLITRADVILLRYEMTVAGGPVLHGNMDAAEGTATTLTSLIPGLAEGLTHMRQGGIARLRVPPRIGYAGNVPAGAPFGPNDTLEFLIRIEQVALGRAAEMDASARAAPPSNPSQAEAERPARR
ncbi:MAG TPA: FKBP-type peptidyl-prolyl cis-trans isomerase [Allosphingosinicella sp.]|nr:FKBP-type peptidyl-prolyl cis-trans isomerase [Allosphingosinicella sp.]